MKKLIALLLITFLFKSVHAQFVYPNEDCNGALPLTATSNGQLVDSIFQTYTFADATPSALTNCLGGNATYDLWYTFTASESQAFIRQIASVNMQVFTGTCASLAAVSCDSNLTGLTPGQQYYVRTYAPDIFYASQELLINLLSPLTNDDCSNAHLLPVITENPLAHLQKFTTDFATTPGSSCVAFPAWANLKDIWFKFVATGVSHAVFFQTPGITKAVALSGTPGNFIDISSYNFSANSVEGVMELTNLTPGETYYIGVGSPTGAVFSLVITAPPANDECANADTVQMSTGYDCNSTFGSRRVGASSSVTPCSTIKRDVWHIFKATSNDVIIRVIGDGVIGSKLALLDGSCGSLNCIASSSNNPLTYSGLTVGNYYYLRSGEDYTPLLICISPWINNDDCAAAITLPVNAYGNIFSNYGYNKYATSSLPQCGSSNPSKDVWYKFTATDTACIVNTYLESGSSGAFEVFSGNCSSLNSIFCSSINTGKRVSGLTQGNTYYVRFYDSFNPGLFTLDIADMPANDDCAGATALSLQPDLFYEQGFDNGISQATTSAAPCIATVYTNDLWYTFTPTQNNATVISHEGQSAFGIFTGFEIFSGTCGSLNSIRCVEQDEQHEVINLTNLVANQTYYIRQFGNIPGNKLTIVNSPVNDKIASAFPLSITPANVGVARSYTTHGATVDFGKLCSTTAQPFNDVWFYFVADATTANISTGNFDEYWGTAAFGLSYRIETFDGFASDSSALAPKLISCGNNSLALTGLTAGDTIYVRVYNNVFQEETSIFSITVTGTQSIDDPAGALQLNVNNKTEFQINTTGATQTLPASGCTIVDFPDDDVWFKFTASANAKRVVAGYESKDITLQLFSGTPGNLSAIKCSNNILLLPNNLTNGTTYYVRAYSKANATASRFRIGLFSESDGITNTCLSNSCTGPNLIANPRCESDYPYVIPPNYGNWLTQSLYIVQTKLVEGWWNTSYNSADRWDADYPVKAPLGNVMGDSLGNYSRTAIPRNGKGMLGMLYIYAPNWSEYVTGKLTSPLIPGKDYLVSFYVTISSVYANSRCNNIGAYLSTDSSITSSRNYINVKPHVANAPGERITANKTWVNVCGIVRPTQPYQYITIGNFGPEYISNNTAGETYFFIDEVLVAEDLCSSTGIEENPGSDESKMTLDVFPNPAKDYVNVRWSVAEKEEVELFINDISGRLVWKSGLVKVGLSQLQIETKHLHPGFYTISLQAKQNKAATKFIISR